ncbi:MAG TPA: BMP family protein [Gaiellaceae bacterium]|nr:BMP family protein [Gaiellaceae bacterium]
MRRLRVPALLSAAAALVVAGAALAGSQGSGSAQAKVKVALVLPCPTNDGSWCQQAFVAAKQLQKEGLIDLSYTSNAPQDTAGASQVIERYAANGAQLVIADSAWQDAAFAAAKKFPKVPIVYAGGGKVGGNVSTFEEPIYQPAYLAGILAAGITKTKVVGALAAFDIPLCHAQAVAFIKGAQSVDAGIKGVTSYVGDWNDVAKGKNAALALASQKADVFTVCGGGPASGLISALKEKNLSGFGYVGNQNGLAPKQMVGSLVYNLYPIFKAIVQDVANGKYKGKDYDLGLQSFKLMLNPKYSVARIPQKSLAKEKQVASSILAGSFKVPYVIK